MKSWVCYSHIHVELIQPIKTKQKDNQCEETGSNNEFESDTACSMLFKEANWYQTTNQVKGDNIDSVFTKN